MTLREIVAVMVGFLKKSADTTPKNTAEPIKQEPQKPAEKVVAPAESVVLPTEEKTAPPPKHTPESLAPTQKTATSENKPPVTQEGSSTTSKKLPQDSMLRRHYLTQLHAQVAANLPTRPTDSMLRRHYDTLLENEVKKQLNCQG